MIVASAAMVDAHGLDAAIKDYDPSAPAARVNGRTMTVGELTVLLGMRSARFRAGSSLLYGAVDLMQQAAHAPVYELLAEEARGSGMALSASMLEDLERETRSFARRHLYRQKVTSQVQPPTTEQLRELYDQLKDTTLATPERFLIRRISIPFTSDTEAEEAQARLERIKSAFDQGGDIIAILRAEGLSVPSRMFQPDKEPDAPFIDELRASENERALSIHTADMEKELVIRHLHIPSGSVPFESSMRYLSNILVQRQTSALAGEYFKSQADEEGFLQVIAENIGNSGELALDSDVLIVAGGQPVTRGELRLGLGWELDVLSSAGADAFTERVIASGIVQQHLLDAVIARDGIMEQPAVQEYRGNMADTLLVRAWLADEIDDQVATVTDDEAIGIWRMNEAAQGRFHGRVRFDSLVLSPSGDDLEPWVARFHAATGKAEFDAATHQAMQARIGKSLMTGLQDHISYMPVEVRVFVEAATLPAACVTSPDKDGAVTVYWLIQYDPDKSPDEAALEKARRELHDARWQDALEEMLTQRSDDVVVEPLLPEAY
jgi:hypothetical protein